MRKPTSYLLIGLTLVSLTVGAVGCGNRGAIRVATTTSLYDTGLWQYLEPIFEERHGVELDVLYAGTGIALEFGRRGDVDVIVTHSQSREQQFVADGYGVERVPFAYNYFLIVGPQDDPAGIEGMTPEAAFSKLAETGIASFVSRGDDSGTHSKEKAIWAGAGYDYEAIRNAGVWYIAAGRGMGPTLLMASEKRAYTLSDMGTFLSYKGKMDLVPIIDEGSILLNVYAAIVSRQSKSIETATTLVNFLVSPEIQELIGNYGIEEYGTSLFTPCAGAEPQS